MDSMSKPLHAGRAAEAGVTAALAARRRRHRLARRARRRGGLRPRDGRRTGLGPGARDARAGLPHHADDVQEPRLLRPHLRRDRRRARGAGEARRRRARHRARERRHLPRRRLEVAHYEEPRTPAEARFSLKYVVASALAHGSVRLAAFEPARIEDALTRDLMRRVDVAIDPELDATFPGQRAARVAIVARDGRRGEHLQPTRKGDPDAPLTDRELEAKYLELAVPVIGDGRARGAARPAAGASSSSARSRDARAGPVRPARGGARRRFGRRDEEHRAPAAIPAQARLRRAHRRDQRQPLAGARRARLHEPRRSAGPDRPRLRHDAGRHGGARRRGVRRARHSRRHHLHRRLRRDGPGGRGAAGAPRRACACARRAAARAEQHGRRSTSRAASRSR